jgi:hypothetical protein
MPVDPFVEQVPVTATQAKDADSRFRIPVLADPCLDAGTSSLGLAITAASVGAALPATLPPGAVARLFASQMCYVAFGSTIAAVAVNTGAALSAPFGPGARYVKIPKGAAYIAVIGMASGLDASDGEAIMAVTPQGDPQA